MAEKKKQKQRWCGVLSRLWGAIFGRGEDYEKRLKYLSKKENAVNERINRRARASRRMLRSLIVLSAIAEVVAVVYAITSTRTLDLRWKMRVVRILPMFVLPGLSFVIYSTLINFTRMLDRKDQKMLESLRSERQEKINELKERTNYYLTQQLIQKYDLDPAAKAAAATVLASKLGAESGLKVSVGNESKMDVPLVKKDDIKPVSSDGLRNRKQSHVGSNSTVSSIMPKSNDKVSDKFVADGQVGVQGPKVVEHYKGPATNDGGWISRIAALLVGKDPSQCCALICGNCHMHNGLIRKEDFPNITYYCPHCHALNGPQPLEDHGVHRSRHASHPIQGD